jgi:hypothetical protein
MTTRAPALSAYVARQWQRRQPATGWRFFAVLVPATFAATVLDSSDAPWFAYPLLAPFCAWLPLLVIEWATAVLVSRAAERQKKRGLRPRPKAAYLLLAAVWAVASGAAALAAWAAGARSTGPGAEEDWIATGLVWAVLIGGCATVMMAGCALTVATRRRPW